jgi:hypothetical protein
LASLNAASPWRDRALTTSTALRGTVPADTVASERVFALLIGL